MNKSDLKKILELPISDIAYVYGGVRGRTLSSPAQSFAWPIVKECGIKTIIDLRQDGIYTRMLNLCDKFGMEYFYYPVDIEVKHVKEMVTLFPKFCSLIDEGRFLHSLRNGTAPNRHRSMCLLGVLRRRQRHSPSGH